jgi:putative endonuclease
MDNRQHWRAISRGEPVRYKRRAKYCYVYVLRSQADHQFYVGLTRDLPARLQAHNDGGVNSTKKRRPFELVYWEGCRNESDAAQREKYLKTAWGKRYIKNRLRCYLTG